MEEKTEEKKRGVKGEKKIAGLLFFNLSKQLCVKCSVEAIAVYSDSALAQHEVGVFFSKIKVAGVLSPRHKTTPNFFCHPACEPFHGRACPPFRG